MTRGERNSNPGNIRHVKNVTWQGSHPIQGDDSFVTFTSPEMGIRAICRIMRSYKARGLNTIDAIINRWAPPSENNSAAYVSAVCDDCGYDSKDPIDVDAIMPALIKAIIVHENGHCIYTRQQIDAGITLAA